MLVLGIESSCDETAAALVREDGTVLADVVASQIAVHAPYGGVVPELASRAHLTNVLPVIEGALAEVEGFWQIAITTSISVPFFLLEKTASHMQDPFANRPTDTSVTAIARTIHINLAQLLGEEDVPAPLASQGFYIM